jgi:hypothetical protein
MQNANIHGQQKSIAWTTSVTPVLAPAPQGVCGDHTVARGEPRRRKRPSMQCRVVGETAPEFVPPIVYGGPTSPGQPLEAMTQAFMGSRFGHDSVIRLGRVGNDRVYVLQETVAMNPYCTNARRFVDYDWCQVPPASSDDLGWGKSP